MNLIAQLMNNIPCGHLKPFSRWVQSRSVIEKKLILGMVGKGKARIHFCEERPGRKLACPILHPSTAFKPRSGSALSMLRAPVLRSSPTAEGGGAGGSRRVDSRRTFTYTPQVFG